MKSKENMKRALYDVLDWLERECSEHIKVFWTCVFKETIMNRYPTLRQLRNSLMDGQTLFFMVIRVLMVVILLTMSMFSLLVINVFTVVHGP